MLLPFSSLRLFLTTQLPNNTTLVINGDHGSWDTTNKTYPIDMPLICVLTFEGVRSQNTLSYFILGFMTDCSLTLQVSFMYISVTTSYLIIQTLPGQIDAGLQGFFCT